MGIRHPGLAEDRGEEGGSQARGIGSGLASVVSYGRLHCCQYGPGFGDADKLLHFLAFVFCHIEKTDAKVIQTILQGRAPAHAAFALDGGAVLAQLQTHQ